MQILKSALYIFVLLVLQTVIAPRFSVFSAYPDLALVSVVIFAVLRDRFSSTLFSSAFGILQDILSAGLYISFILLVILSNIVSTVKEKFTENNLELAVNLTAICTLLYWLFLNIVRMTAFEYRIGFFDIFSLVISVIYNVIMVFILFPIIEKAVNGKPEK